jgi:hypothetical protein
MGLDQSFYIKKNEEQEVLYFRKFYGLHDEIQTIVGEKLENAKTYRLNKADLEKLVAYIVTYKHMYWAFQNEDDSEELPNNFFKAIGVLTYFIIIDKPLYYNGDW